MTATLVPKLTVKMWGSEEVLGVTLATFRPQTLAEYNKKGFINKIKRGW